MAKFNGARIPPKKWDWFVGNLFEAAGLPEISGEDVVSSPTNAQLAAEVGCPQRLAELVMKLPRTDDVQVRRTALIHAVEELKFSRKR